MSRHHPSKRGLSPNTSPIPFSPAKRRILAVEGIFTPSRSLKTSHMGPTSSPNRFKDVLSGADSPARVLNFGQPKQLAGDPQKRSASEHVQEDVVMGFVHSPGPVHLRRSELQPRKTRPAKTEAESDMAIDDDTVEVAQSASSYILIPRDFPPQSEPHSTHYPGFAVFQDPHLTAFTSPSPTKNSSTGEEEAENMGLVVPSSKSKEMGRDAAQPNDLTLAPLPPKNIFVRPLRRGPRRVLAELEMSKFQESDD